MWQYVSHVKVKSVVYRYTKPPCVDHFFNPHPAVVETGRTSVRHSSFSVSVWIRSFTHVNSCYDYHLNTDLGFALFEEATKTVPSVSRSRATLEPQCNGCTTLPVGYSGSLSTVNEINCNKKERFEQKNCELISNSMRMRTTMRNLEMKANIAILYLGWRSSLRRKLRPCCIRLC